MKLYIFVVAILVTQYGYTQNDHVKYRRCMEGCNTIRHSDDDLNAQFQYDIWDEFITQDVVSDYGVRNAGKGASRFHQAIDYTSLLRGAGDEDKGDAIMAIQAGNVVLIDADRNYKGIKIGDYGYFHIFRNWKNQNEKMQKIGKFILKRVDAAPEFEKQPWAIIDLENCRAICTEENRKITIEGLNNNFCGNNIFYTINYVEEGWDIAPMGGSGGTKGYATHLHLERYVNGSVKHGPNQYVQHQSQDFDIELTTKDNTDVQLKYPGTARNAFRLRAIMKDGHKIGIDRFENVTMNLDKADILLQRNGSNDYEHIVGFEGKNKTRIESKFWLGANHNTTIYPSDWNSRDFGTWTQTGTYPYAHNDANNQIYDDYFFADFYTRIHKDKHDAFADIPSNARYNDGKYKLRSTVTNVRDALFEIPAIDITLDNFLPYITNVNIRFNGDQLYQVIREGNEGGIQTDDGYILNTIHDYSPNPDYYPNNVLTLEVLTSEPMQNVRYALKKAGPTTFPNPVPMTQHLANKLLWTATITSSNIERTCYNLEIKGQDLSENELMDVY